MRECPICGNREKKVLCEYKLSMPEKLQFMPKMLRIAECTNCGVIYSDSEATQETYNRYYETLHNYTIDKNTNSIEEDEWIIKSRRIMYDIIKKYLDKDKYIVDIGTGNGGALRFLEKQGYSKLLGVDLDDKKNIFKDSIIEYEVGNAFNIYECVRNRKSSIFILNGVLEHIFDVKRAIDAIKRAMDYESYLYVMVPNAEKYIDYYDKPFRYFGIEHINHFGEELLKSFFLHSGFKIIENGVLEGNYNQYHVEPELYFVLQKGYTSKEVPTNINYGLKNSVIKYIEKSEEDNLNSKIDEIVNTNAEIVIWGVGSFLGGLLENTNLLKGNIRYFIDNNQSLHDTNVKGIQIKSPQSLYDFKGTILITSALYSDSILKEIRDMGVENEVIVL